MNNQRIYSQQSSKHRRARFALRRTSENARAIVFAWRTARSLALAHAKSGDAAVINGYCGKGDVLPEAIVRFAVAYSNQTFMANEAFVVPSSGSPR
jgi:hypothetical protein